jgi:hypothetical protein
MQQEQTPEQLHHGGSIQGRQAQEFPVGRENTIRDKPVAVRVEVGSVGTVRLKRKDTPRPHVLAPEQRLKDLQYRSISGLRQQSQQAALAFEQAPQYARNPKGPVTVRYGSEYLERRRPAGISLYKTGALVIGVPLPARRRRSQ